MYVNTLVNYLLLDFYAFDRFWGPLDLRGLVVGALSASLGNLVARIPTSTKASFFGNFFELTLWLYLLSPSKGVSLPLNTVTDFKAGLTASKVVGVLTQPVDYLDILKFLNLAYFSRLCSLSFYRTPTTPLFKQTKFSTLTRFSETGVGLINLSNLSVLLDNTVRYSLFYSFFLFFFDVVFISSIYLDLSFICNTRPSHRFLVTYFFK